MKLTKRSSVLYVSLYIVIASGAVNGADKRSSAAIGNAELPKPEISTQYNDSDLAQELKIRFSSLQDRIDKIEQMLADYSKKTTDNQTVQADETVLQKLKQFLKDNAFTLLSLACTLTALYMTYYFSHESLMLNRASFAIDKGEKAFKALKLIATGQCSVPTVV